MQYVIQTEHNRCVFNTPTTLWQANEHQLNKFSIVHLTLANTNKSMYKTLLKYLLSTVANQ